MLGPVRVRASPMDGRGRYLGALVAGARAEAEGFLVDGRHQRRADLVGGRRDARQCQSRAESARRGTGTTPRAPAIHTCMPVLKVRAKYWFTKTVWRNGPKKRARAHMKPT